MDKHYTPASTKIIGVNSSGITKDLLFIDEVEEYLNQGDYNNFIRVIVLNHEEDSRDSFYFDVEDNYRLVHSYIQTSEETMELLTLYMQMTQRKTNLNEFVTETAKKMKADLVYTDVRMVS